MEEETTVEEAARQIVERHGQEAIEIIRRCREFAESIGDRIASKEWRQIADAAERIVHSDEPND